MHSKIATSSEDLTGHLAIATIARHFRQYFDASLKSPTEERIDCY